MLAYKTTRCPYCKAKIEVMKPYGVNDYGNDLGEPYGNCPSCGKQYKTGKQGWGQMNIFTKLIIIVKLIFNILMSSFLLSVFFLLFIYFLKEKLFQNSFNWFETNDFSDLIIIVAIILSPFLTIGGIIRLRQEIKEFK